MPSGRKRHPIGPTEGNRVYSDSLDFDQLEKSMVVWRLAQMGVPAGARSDFL